MEKNSDIDTCYHGKKLSDCNSGMKHNKMKECLFWHFSPDDKKEELQKKYFQIMKHFG